MPLAISLLPRGSGDMLAHFPQNNKTKKGWWFITHANKLNNPTIVNLAFTLFQI